MDQLNNNPSEQNLNSQPVVTPNLPNQLNKSNSFLKIIIILLLIIFLGLGIFLGKTYLSPQTPLSQPIVSVSTPTPTTIPKVDPTANWKTYSNIAQGFEIKYPNEWRVEEIEKKIYFYRDISREESLKRYGFTGPLFIIQFDPTKYNSIEEWFKKEFTDRQENLKPKYSPLLIDNVQGIRYKDGVGEGGCNEEYAFIKKSVLFWMEKGGSTCDYPKEIFNQILSTFKFTDQETTTQTENWKTYTNSKLGFELKYPPSVVIDKEFNDQYNRAAIFKSNDLNFEVMLRNNNGITLDKYYYMDSEAKRKTTLDKMPANIYELPNGYCDGPSCSKPSITIVAEKGTDLYHVIFYGDIQLSEMENQILSTFKFTQ